MPFSDFSCSTSPAVAICPPAVAAVPPLIWDCEPLYLSLAWVLQVEQALEAAGLIIWWCGLWGCRDSLSFLCEYWTSLVVQQLCLHYHYFNDSDKNLWGKPNRASISFVFIDSDKVANDWGACSVQERSFQCSVQHIFYQISSNPYTYMELLETTFCKNCDKHIYRSNYDLHIEKFHSPEVPIEDPSIRMLRAQSRVSWIIDKFNCVYCGMDMEPNHIDEHLQICDYKPKKCEYCDSEFPLCLMEEHMSLCNVKEQTERMIKQMNQVEIGQNRPKQQQQYSYSNVFRDRDLEDQEYQVPPRNSSQVRMEDIYMYRGEEQENEDPLSKEELAELPETVYKYGSKHGSQECAVCFSTPRDGELVTALPCFHIYHSSCIKEWLAFNCKCPVCKVSVRIQKM